MHFAEKRSSSCSLVGVDKILRKKLYINMLFDIFKSYQGWLNSVLSVPGGGSVFCYRDVQAAAGGGGCLGDDQRAVGPHHFLHAHIRAHSGRIRDSEKTEPAG